jgi:hypothetical protein
MITPASTSDTADRAARVEVSRGDASSPADLTLTEAMRDVDIAVVSPT